MTIKQQGGIFGRNPKFNEVEVTSLGVGTNAPEVGIHVYDSFPEVRLQDSDNTNDFTRFYHTGGNLVFDARNDSSDGQYIFRGYGGGTSSEYLRIDTSGNIKFKNAGQGIDFSATSGTGTSELFDDYEEGTWTPAVIGTTTVGAGTYSIQSGVYTKVGNKVLFEAQLTWSAHTGTGNMRVSGLPFTNGVGFSSSCLVLPNGITVTAGAQVGANVSATTIVLYNVDAGGLTFLPLDTAGSLTLSGQYSV